MNWLKKLKEFILKKPYYHYEYISRFCLLFASLSVFYLFHVETPYAPIIFAIPTIIIGAKVLWVINNKLKFKRDWRLIISFISAIISVFISVYLISNPEFLGFQREIFGLILTFFVIFFLPTLIAYFMQNSQIKEIFKLNLWGFVIIPWFAAMFLLCINIKNVIKGFISEGYGDIVAVPKKLDLIIFYENLSKADKLLVDYLYKNYLNKKIFYRFAEIKKDIDINKSTLSRGLDRLLKNEILEVVNAGKKRKVYTFSEEFIKQKNIYNSREK
jgi:predicted transcriptional regulator